MIHCTGTIAEETLGSYLEGTLSEDEALQFEEHYFDCPECLARVEALQAVARQLAKQPRPQIKAPAPWPVRLGALVALAAMLLISIVVLRARHEARQPSVASAPPAPGQQSSPVPSHASPVQAPPLSQLADLALPPFQTSQLRGESRNPQFEAGMAAYASHDCTRAIKALAQVPAEDEDARGAHFYSGVCLIQQGDLAGAAQRLRKVANGGDSPQQEAAYYYLAQIALEHNDGTAARRSLGHAVHLHGDFEARAQVELSRVRIH